MKNLRRLLRTRPELILAPALLAAFLLTWESAVRLFEIPDYIIPTPTSTAAALWRGLHAGPFQRSGYWLHAGITFGEILLGFVAGSATGLLLGTVISQIRLLEATLRLYLVAIQSLPKIALAPLIVLWFGFGITSKIIIIALLTFFPLLVNSMAGFRATEPDRLELMRAIGATRWQVFWKLRLPGALPYIFAGLEMASVFAVVGAVVGEFVGAQSGLGTLILAMNAQMDMAGTFSVLVILSLFGMILHASLRALQKRIVFWAPQDEGTIGT